MHAELKVYTASIIPAVEDTAQNKLPLDMDSGTLDACDELEIFSDIDNVEVILYLEGSTYEVLPILEKMYTDSLV
ncbi:hypothetical protein ACH5RR_006815 [Cinchona calisaya]|uniref:Uncharacterized protein n=1 Tax=Cinchona calisaya TaxID=153742 RepID=A0ABD3AQ06_9GENT